MLEGTTTGTYLFIKSYFISTFIYHAFIMLEGQCLHYLNNGVTHCTPQVHSDLVKMGFIALYSWKNKFHRTVKCFLRSWDLIYPFQGCHYLCKCNLLHQLHHAKSLYCCTAECKMKVHITLVLITILWNWFFNEKNVNEDIFFYHRQVSHLGKKKPSQNI